VLEQVRNALSGDDEELSAEELLDVLWLAARLPPAAATALSRPAAGAVPSASPSGGPDIGIPAGDVAHPRDPCNESGPAEEPAGSARPPAPRESLHAAPATSKPRATSSDRPAIPVRAPGMKALGGAELRLGRALRPLKQWRSDALRTELDIEATVTAMAETGLPEAVVRPARTRWLDLAVLVDDGVSMLLWQRLAGEIRALMERSGAFRHVRVHGLDSRGEDGPLLSHRPFCTRDATLPMSTVLDPSGTTLVLVVSDGVGRAWRTGRMHAALLRAAATGPTALVHVLPRELRAGSGIGAEPWRVTTRRRGAANLSWHIEDPVLPPELAPFDGVPVPVLGTDPGQLGAWARLVGSAGGSAVLPLLTAAGTEALGAERSAAVRDGTGAEEAVLRFREAASPDAYRLAAHLAAVAPLPVPVMRLVQHAVSPPADTSHLAEVFLGGLMHGVDSSDSLPHQRTFDFTEETRSVLLGTVAPAELMRTTRAVTTRLTELAGSPAGFPAWLPHAQGPERVPGNDRRPFGWVDETVMRRLGVAPPDSAEPDPPASGTEEWRALPAGFELRSDATGWQRMPATDPRFDGPGAPPYEVFAEHLPGWSRTGLFLAHDGEGRILILRRPEVPYGRELVAREVTALKRMDGVYAPRPLAWDTGCDRPWLVAECALDGRTETAPDLSSFVERHGELYEDGLLTVARQCANGLARAHRKGLVHGALTAHTVLIAGREVQISGWTTATVDGDASRYGGRHRKDPRYRAPELSAAEAEPTPAGDVYALGRILVDATAGVDAEPGSPEELVLPVSAGIADALRACLAPDPAHRPTAQQLLATFNALSHEREPWKRRLTVTLGLDDDWAPVQLDLESAERGGQGPHLLCQGRPASVRRDLLHRVVEQLTRAGQDDVELVLADAGGVGGLAQFGVRLGGNAFLGLAENPMRPLALAEKINSEVMHRRRRLESATAHRDIGSLEAAARRNPNVPHLPRLIVAMDEVDRILRLSPELRTTLTRAAESGGRLGIHLVLFADAPGPNRLDQKLMRHVRTRVDLLTRPASTGRYADVLPDGAVLVHPTAPAPIRFGTGHGPASEQPPPAGRR
jgi:hypothetical protein